MTGKTKEVVFEYFTQQEADLFAFYIIPKELFTNERYKHSTCTDSKVLYGLLRDRNQLSTKNGWVDKDGHIFIYFSREEVCAILGISFEKAVKLFKELNEVGLIKEIRQGLNRPNIIYVGKILPESKENQWISDFPISGYRENRCQNIGKTDSNNTEYNNTKLNDTEKRKLNTQVSNKTHTGFKRENITPAHSEQVQGEEKAVCEQVAPAIETLRKDTKAFLEGKKASYPLVEKSIPAEPTRSTQLPVYSEQAQQEEQKAVCEKTVSLEALQTDIQAVIGEEINVMRLARLIQTASLERIQYHLEHWHIHKQNQTRKGAGYFLTVVENDIQPTEPEKKSYGTQEKKPQRDNFEQREYSDEQLESFYANLVT